MVPFGGALWKCPLEVPFGGALWKCPLEVRDAGPSTPPGKQRVERRAEWKTRRRQVIKVTGGAVLRGCKKTRRKLKAHFQLRAEIHSQLRVTASLFVLRIFLTCLDPEPEAEAEAEPEREPAPAPPTLRPPSALLAARHPPPAAPTGPPMPLASEDPVMLQKLQVFCEYFANSNKLTPNNQLQRCPGRPKQKLHFILKPAFDDPSYQELLAKLQQLGSTNLTGDHNTVSRHSMQLAVAMQQDYSNPGKRLRGPGWSGEEALLFIKLTCGYSLNSDSPEQQSSDLDKAHVKDLKEEAAKQRRLLALEEGDSLQDTIPLPCRMRHAVHVCRCLEQ
ncbi:hypothetical protein QJQ45_005653 [Haematococcus lacustris]|nr:hypothetical protein QJQ45_000346 [Haematococcus lacustris]KAJ9527919.1 hypothetical protein QJQ45_005653 [Haematococcus lacustris]